MKTHSEEGLVMMEQTHLSDELHTVRSTEDCQSHRKLGGAFEEPGPGDTLLSDF